MTTTPTPVPLFREKVFRKSDKSVFGGVILPNPVAISVLSWVSFGLVLLLLYFICTVEYTKRLTAAGWLVARPGVAEITAPNGGSIDHLFVEEGSRVAVGAPLFSINQNAFAGDGASLNAAILAALEKERQSIESRIQYERETAAHERGALRNQKALTAASLESSRRLLENAQRKTRLSRSEYERMLSFYESGHLPKRDLDLVERNMVSEQIEAERIAQSIVDLEYKLQGIELDLDAAPKKLKKSLDELTALLSDVVKRQVEASARDQGVVKATVDGVVTGIVANVGDSISSGKRILSIIPGDSKLVGEIFLPTDSAAMVRIGSTVDVRYDSLPIQQYGHFQATITSIEKRPLLNEQQILYRSNTPLYRAVLSVEDKVKSRAGSHLQLKQGMTLSATIRVHRRRLVDWVLDPTFELLERES